MQKRSGKYPDKRTESSGKPVRPTQTRSTNSEKCLDEYNRKVGKITIEAQHPDFARLLVRSGSGLAGGGARVARVIRRHIIVVLGHIDRQMRRRLAQVDRGGSLCVGQFFHQRRPEDEDPEESKVETERVFEEVGVPHPFLQVKEVDTQNDCGYGEQERNPANGAVQDLPRVAVLFAFVRPQQAVDRLEDGERHDDKPGLAVRGTKRLVSERRQLVERDDGTGEADAQADDLKRHVRVEPDGVPALACNGDEDAERQQEAPAEQHQHAVRQLPPRQVLHLYVLEAGHVAV
eukprot:4808491-Pleurochrysis_carterae.AAC.1